MPPLGEVQQPLINTAIDRGESRGVIPFNRFNGFTKQTVSTV
jgi:hypothetical protein